ncbi:MAG: AraC family transcriptional regulator [Pseudomonadota bacterium]
MSKDDILRLIADRTTTEGLTPSGLPGVSLFRVTEPVPCIPAVYEPCIVAIVSGEKETVLDGKRYVYDASQYLCCPVSMPVNAGTPTASPEAPLFGVLVSLDPRVMTTIAMEMENAGGAAARSNAEPRAQGIRLARWAPDFTDALLRLLQLTGDETDIAILGEARLRELYYAVLKGEAGGFARQAFSPANAISRSIAHVSANLEADISIDDLANRAGMSRAAFHRKFKEATTMAPIQFVKSMRLNSAAMNIAGGMTVNEAAFGVGYASASQFSREFKRMYGQSPKQWGSAQQRATEIA